MISPDLRFEGFDVESWTNLIALFSPGIVDRMATLPRASDDQEFVKEVAEDPSSAKRRGSLIIVVDAHDRVLKGLHSSHGRVPDLEYEGPESLPDLTRRYGALRTVVLREGAADEMAERLALRLQRGDDYVTQWLAFARIFREMQEAKQVWVHPQTLDRVPLPSSGTVRRALDILLPDDHSAVFTIWHRRRPHTTLAIRRRRGVIDRVVGPDLITRWVGPLGGDFRRDHRVIVEAVSHAFAPVHIGIFADLTTIEQLLRGASPGIWAQAVAIRDVVVYPTPPYLAVALGADAVRGVTHTTRRLLGGIDLFDVVAPFTDLLRSRVSEVASVRAVLGFDPLSALATWLRRHDEPTDATEPTDAESPHREGHI